MLKVLFLINTLGGGGAERVLVNLVNNMDREKYDITVETMYSGGENQKRLAPHIRYFCRKALCFPGIAYAYRFLPARLLYRYFIGKERYDIIVAYMHGAPTKVIAGCPHKDIKRLTWLHTGTPEKSTFFKFWFTKKQAFAAYASCDAVVGVAKSVSDAFSAYTGIRDNVCVVYNTNDTKVIHESAQKGDVLLPMDGILISTVGRLVAVKGFDRLISVATRLHKEGFSFRLVIVGSGECEEQLKAQIKENDAGEYVLLAGHRENPYPLVNASDLFVCSSLQEGLSTAVTEAILLGVPVISTQVSGAFDILGTADEYGMVVENSEDGLYRGIKQFLENPDLRRQYEIKARERRVFFQTDETVRQAQGLFERVMAGKCQ